MASRPASGRIAAWSLRVTTVLALIALAAPTVQAGCEPRSLTAWRTRCLADRDAVRDALSAARSTRTFADLDGVGNACRVLAASGADLDGARAQFLALLLSVGSSRLDRDCCVSAGADGVVPIAELVRRADAALAGGADENTIARVSRRLAEVNDGAALAPCGSATDGDHSHQHGDGDGHHHGEGPERGRGHEEHGNGLGLGHDRDAGHAAGHPGAGHGQSSTCCDPHTAEWWERACERRADHERVLAVVDAECRRDLGRGACEALRSGEGDACARTRRQVAAFRLNLRAGLLDRDCQLENGRSVEEARARVARLIAAGECEEAATIARGINTGTHLGERSPCDARPPGPAHGPGSSQPPQSVFSAQYPQSRASAPARAPALGNSSAAGKSKGKSKQK